MNFKALNVDELASVSGGFDPQRAIDAGRRAGAKGASYGAIAGGLLGVAGGLALGAEARSFETLGVGPIAAGLGFVGAAVGSFAGRPVAFAGGVTVDTVKQLIGR